MRQNNRKIISLGVLIICLSLLFTACNGVNQTTGNEGSDETKELLMYDLGLENEPSAIILKQAIEDFNNRDDINATIEIRFIPSDTYYTKLNASVAANEAPDLFELHAAGRMKNYVDADRIISLSDALNADTEWKNRFNEGVFDLVTFDGKIYGIPTTLAVVPMFYNKQIFSDNNLELPSSYEELKSLIETLKSEGIIPFAMGGKEAWVPALFSEVVANRVGGNEPFDQLMSGEGTWQHDSFIEMGKVMQDLAEIGAFGDTYLGLSNDAMVSMFQNGEAAMMVTGSWAIGTLVAEESQIKDVVGVTKFPTVSDGKGSIDTWLGQPNDGYVVSSTAKDKDAAIAFIKTISSDEIQKKYVEETGQISVTKVQIDPAKSPQVAQDLGELMKEMDGLFIFYDVGMGPQIGEEYNNKIQEILAGKDPADAFDELQVYTDGVLEAEEDE